MRIWTVYKVGPKRRRQWDVWHEPIFASTWWWIARAYCWIYWWWTREYVYWVEDAMEGEWVEDHVYGTKEDK